jgi:hypothetical protein
MIHFKILYDYLVANIVKMNLLLFLIAKKPLIPNQNTGETMTL